MKVEIRPIAKKKWHGKKGKEDFTRPKVIQALVNSHTFQYDTGVPEERRVELEEKLDVELSPNYSPNHPHAFWDSKAATLKLENNTMYLNKNNPLEEIKYYIAKASKFVANSLREFEDGQFPEATHVIFDEKEEAEVKARKIEVINQATARVGELPPERKIQLLFILAGKNAKQFSTSQLVVAMDELISSKAAEILRELDKDTDLVENHALVIECLQKSVLQKKGHKIYYHDSHLGDDTISVADYLGQNVNQDLKLKLIEQIS
jgi:hypothetical protein